MDVSHEVFMKFIEKLNKSGVEVVVDAAEDVLDKEVAKLDFSEHDKQSLKEIARLNSEITHLKKESDKIKKLNDECCEENVRLIRENKELIQMKEATKLPYEPIEVAQILINADEIKDRRGDVWNCGYSLSQLRQIAEHLLVYCNNNEDGE